MTFFLPNRLSNLLVFPLHRRGVWLLALPLLLAGCVSTKSAYTRDHVARRLQARGGYELGTARSASALAPALPTLQDGLSEDEAIRLALTRNPAFQADLSTLALAQADLQDAGLLPNPVLSLVTAHGTAPFSMALSLASDLLWQRLSRVGAAQLETQRVAESLVSRGLLVSRDAQVSYTDITLADERLRIAREAIVMRAEVARIVRARYRAGEASELETVAPSADSLRAVDDYYRARRDNRVARLRLLATLGLDSVNADSLRFTAAPVSATLVPPLPTLLDSAYAARPDLWAARVGIEGIGQRLRWERSRVFSFIVSLDARFNNPNPVHLGPGATIGLPLFNRNQGRISRVKAELEQASWQYLTLRQTVNLDVREAYAQYEQATQSVALWERSYLPSLQDALRRSTNAFINGDFPYVQVAETTRQLLDAQQRAADARADQRRALARLRYAVGGRF
ncbi:MULTISPECIES: TolC family protein [Hymenobacter]|uniref:TolC family protein n=2 Tax=Hymenobacter TaxID=89966 RepID=A0A4Z0MDN8_9BACT|nr:MULTISPECIES: TolC family protein [Hymenobacter]TGD77345.1 TolC family protein [Hymenobacter wooponensis]TGE03563.1 TolC family protein [Hymenobacter fodinae]